VTSTIYVLVNLAAVMRVAAAFWSMTLLVGSACLWIAAFAGFVLCYSPMLLQPGNNG